MAWFFCLITVLLASVCRSYLSYIFWNYLNVLRVWWRVINCRIFFWCMVVNSGIYRFTTVAVLAFRRTIVKTQQKIFGLDEGVILTAVHRYLAMYKLFITVLISPLGLHSWLSVKDAFFIWVSISKCAVICFLEMWFPSMALVQCWRYFPSPIQKRKIEGPCVHNPPVLIMSSSYDRMTRSTIWLIPLFLPGNFHRR